MRQSVDGETALQGVRRQPPDLLILDLLMPNMNGFAVREAVRQDPATRHLPVIVVTGLDLSLEQSTWSKERTAVMLQKSSFRGELLLGEVRRMLGVTNRARKTWHCERSN